MKPFVPTTLVEKYFAELSAIPRLSEYEKQAANYVVTVASLLGLRCRRDDLHNVVIRKPATPGYESAPEVMLQAHLDMVGVSAPDYPHDFTRNPLSLFVDEQGNLRAEGTTLGADDGYGCAYLLAIMEEDFPHPPLTLVFTAQEENGCHGAKALDCADIPARRMIGLDVMGSDIEYTSTVSCYCSDRLTVRRACAAGPADGPTLRLAVHGLQPIHTGALVHPEQGNAIKIMARLLKRLELAGVAFRLAEMAGGVAENYNPARCEATIIAADPSEAERVLRDELRLIDAEVQDGTQSLALDIEPARCGAALTEADTLALVNLLYLTPSATQAIAPADQRMIVTNNVGQVSLAGGAFELVMSDRARTVSCKEGVNRRVEALAHLCGASLSVEKRYEPWPYLESSALKRETAALMREVYGHDMEENICPGGLEICDLLPKMTGLDCVMFAPIGGGCHTTAEWMNLESFNRVYEFLKTLLGRLKA